MEPGQSSSEQDRNDNAKQSADLFAGDVMPLFFPEAEKKVALVETVPLTSSCNDDDVDVDVDVAVADVSGSEKNATKESSSCSNGCANVTSPPLEMGDHVYQNCSFFGIPSVYQHHGIVLDIWRDESGENEDDDDDDWTLRIADFSDWTPDRHQGKASDDDDKFKKSLCAYSSSSAGSCIRVYESSFKKERWNKVEYGVVAGFLRSHLFHRAGTYTAATTSPPGLVRARMEFLLQHPEYLPPYSGLFCNCECVAVWCKTGTWGTLQATSWLSLTAAGQVKSTATLAGVVSTTQVTVPAAGLWGWLGYTTQVSLVSMHPYLVPAIAAYGVVTVGAPLLWLWRVKKQWKELTIQLNQAFWESAVDQPDLFVECITEWSSLTQPSLPQATRSAPTSPSLGSALRERESALNPPRVRCNTL